MAKLTKAQQAERAKSIEQLRALLKPGDTIFTRLDHVSASGMRREITPLLIRGNEPLYLTYLVATAMGDRIGKHDGIVCDGRGMDMGFNLVYNLGSTLWPNGTPEPHGRRNGEPDSDGGYALKQRWL